MVGRKSSLIVGLVAIAAIAWHQRPHELCAGFLPENSMKIPVDAKNAGGITEEQFNDVLDRVEAVYKPIIAKMGGRLNVVRKWEDPTVNAYANRGWGGTWNITMFGGLARHQAITPDGFAVVACHELGHHIGGYPKKFGWASNEGQSDYFATLKCMRVLYGEGMKSVPREECSAAHGGGQAGEDCERNAMAGLSLASLFQDLRNLPKPPDFSTPDENVVERHDNNHPAPQCRLDTYFQGGLCTKSTGEDVSNSDPLAGTCNRSEGYRVGVRPRCWYAPPKAAEPQVAVRDQLPKMDRVGARISALAASLNAS
jgi:hypothetical protein